MQRFGDVGDLAQVRRAYIAQVIEEGSKVEDAITGKRLLIKKQLLSIEMATGEEALQLSGDELRSFDPLDLVWAMTTDLQPGDRVRLRTPSKDAPAAADAQIEGTIGFLNDDQAVRASSPTLVAVNHPASAHACPLLLLSTRMFCPASVRSP